MNGHYWLRAARIFAKDGELRDGVVEVAAGQVVRVSGADAFSEVEELVDLGDSILAPGFVDLHVHGNGGAWWGQSNESDIGIAKRMAAGGTTACLASLGGRRTLEEILASIRTTAGTVGTAEGATVLGIHMEGPFISPAKRGAWMPEQLRAPNVDELRAMQDAARGAIKTMTIAPELPGALEVASEATRLGIRPAIGHTNATYEEARAGIESGMTYATHTFNAMSGLHHRDPGAVGAILASPQVDAELIADGQHVARGAIEVLLAAKGTDRVMLVTDNVALSGMPPGAYGEGERSVRVTETGLTLPDGTIAGSVLPFNRHVANVESVVGLTKALKMASTNAARGIGVDARKGSIESGKDADLIALSPTLEVRLTIAGGRVVYRDAAFEPASRMSRVG